MKLTKLEAFTRVIPEKAADGDKCIHVWETEAWAFIQSKLVLELK